MLCRSPGLRLVEVSLHEDRGRDGDVEPTGAGKDQPDRNLQNIPNQKVQEDENDELKILASQFRKVFIPNLFPIGYNIQQRFL